MWTFHYEEHTPAQCDLYTCYCGPGGRAGCPYDTCMPSSQYRADACPMHDGLPCGNTTICDPVRLSLLRCRGPSKPDGGVVQGWPTSTYGSCGREHLEEGADPQFVGSATFDGFTTQVNHEIDIEVSRGVNGGEWPC